MFKAKKEFKTRFKPTNYKQGQNLNNFDQHAYAAADDS